MYSTLRSVRHPDKEGDSDTCYNRMSLEDTVLSEKARHQRTDIVWCHSWRSLEESNPWTERRGRGPRGWGKWGVSECHSVMSDTLQSHGLWSPWNSPGQNTGVGSRSLLQGTFPTQGSNPGLPHYRQILYQLSPTLCDPTDLSPLGFSRLWDFPGKGTRVGCRSVPQGIFPTQGANPRVPHLPILCH